MLIFSFKINRTIAIAKVMKEWSSRFSCKVFSAYQMKIGAKAKLNISNRMDSVQKESVCIFSFSAEYKTFKSMLEFKRVQWCRVLGDHCQPFCGIAQFVYLFRIE